MGGQLPEVFPYIMLLAVVTGAVLNRAYKTSLPVSTFEKLWIGLAAFSGAVLTAKLPYLIPGIPGFAEADNILSGGKTVLFGMAGGYFGVELAKWHIGMTLKTGDSFAVPVAASIAIGRLACFCAGCCYGTPSNLPWAVAFPSVDHLTRHPTQLYEFAFHITAAVILARLHQRQVMRGQLIKAYFLAYFCYRFVTEFIRPEEHVAAGLTAYQWTALLLIFLFGWLWKRDSRLFHTTQVQHRADAGNTAP